MDFIKLVLERCNENSFYIKDDGVDKNILLDLEKMELLHIMMIKIKMDILSHMIFTKNWL